MQGCSFLDRLLLFLGGGAAQAQPRLSMEQAVAQALARAPELRAARQEEVGAAARVEQARSAYLPRLSAEVSYLARWPRSELPIELPDLPGVQPIVDIDDVHHLRAGVGAGLRLFDLSRGSRVDAARRGLAAERARTRETAAALAFGVRATFLQALFAREVRRISADSLWLALAEEKRARLRSEVGTGSQVALAQARVRVATLKIFGVARERTGGES